MYRDHMGSSSIPAWAGFGGRSRGVGVWPLGRVRGAGPGPEEGKKEPLRVGGHLGARDDVGGRSPVDEQSPVVDLISGSQVQKRCKHSGGSTHRLLTEFPQTDSMKLNMQTSIMGENSFASSIERSETYLHKIDEKRSTKKHSNRGTVRKKDCGSPC